MRTLTKSTLKIGIAAAALSLLAGAKGDGCGGGETDPPPPPACEEGYHIEQICEPACGYADDASVAPGEEYPCDVLSCTDTCVPDEQCPDGTYEQWVCYGGGPDDPTEPQPLSHPCAEGDPDCGGHGEETCYLECVPIEVCGPGYHEEWICYGDDGYPKPLPADEEPGDSGGGSEDGVAPPEECYSTCVPDGCPPGTIEQVICADVYYADEEGGEGGEPVPPEECWTECVPEAECPPGQHPEEVCEEIDTCNEPVCKIVCVDDCGPTCDPTLICGDALTCVNGLMYPTTCGPDNCDDPIGVCGDDCDPTLACPEVLTCIGGLLYPTGCGPENCDEPIGDCDKAEM